MHRAVIQTPSLPLGLVLRFILLGLQASLPVFFSFNAFTDGGVDQREMTRGGGEGKEGKVAEGNPRATTIWRRIHAIAISEHAHTRTIHH